MTNLVNKTIIRKTKKGGVVKVVREHYLRNDICCGIDTCSVCKCCPGVSCLQAPSKSSKISVNRSQVVVPDVEVIINQIDVLEDSQINNVLILQTVIDEVKRRNPAINRRIREVISNPDRHYYVFCNEFHKDTYTPRLPKETKESWQTRCIEKALSWYRQHRENSPDIHFIPLYNAIKTDHAESQTPMDIQNEEVSIQDYVGSLPNSEMLFEKLAYPEKVTEQADRSEPRYPAHLTLGEINRGIKSGRLVQGTFYGSRENYLEATVSINDTDDTVFIQGSKNLNRSVHSDIVAVEILPEDQWTCPSSVIRKIDEDGDLNNDNDEENEGEVTSRSIPLDLRQKSGRVVGIIKRKWRQYCGILQSSASMNVTITEYKYYLQSTRQIFVPAEKRIPKIRLETRQAERLTGKRIIAAIDSWPRHSRYPLGHFVRVLGNLGDKETENEVLLLEHDIPHLAFSQKVLDCLPKEPWAITEEDMRHRQDLRTVSICSVDPPGCTDIDDALHCRAKKNGNYEVGVHIADVSHFIRHGTAIDSEAMDRGTTVYLTDRRIDMVPELLSSNLCSLRSNVDRLAFSVIWEITKTAKIVATKFTKSVINSKASLTYAEAQMAIDDSSRSDDLAESLRRLNALAKILRQRRLDNGALTLASTEIRFSVDSESHDPIDVETKEIRDTNSMVEEFMLLANISVAEKILSDFPDCAVLRRHPAPPLSNFEPVIKAAESMGFTIDVSTSKALADSLESARLPDDPYFNTMLRIMTTRCMMQAVYFCSGHEQQADFVHYGLATPIYTHFTSPIRRYSDIMVHRLLAVTIGADSTYSDLLSKDKSQLICNGLNYRHRMAQYAGRASVSLHTQLFFKDRIVDESAYVLFVRKNAFQILVPKFGLEGTIYLYMPGEKSQFTYNEQDNSQSCGGVTIRVFDPIIVQISIDSKNVQHLKLLFKLVKPEIPGFTVASSLARTSDQDEPSPKKKKVNTSSTKMSK